MLVSRCKAAREHRESQEAVADAENDAAANIRDDQSVGGLEHAAQRIVSGGERSDREIAHSQLFHHERINHSQHRGLEMIEEMSAADNAEQSCLPGECIRWFLGERNSYVLHCHNF